jgi:uncharacterized protein (DUF58 family)
MGRTVARHFRLTSPDDRTRWRPDPRAHLPQAGTLNAWARRWAHKRQGADPDPVELAARRIYILPSALGIAYAAMVFAMIIGAMNYANNLALGLAFLLGALGLVAMHHCHGNLLGLRLAVSVPQPVFAGGQARFGIALENGARLARHGVVVTDEFGESDAVTIKPDGRAVVAVRARAAQRGRLRLGGFRLGSRYPFGLFRSWTWMHLPLECVVYPRPSDLDLAPPPRETDVGSAQESRRGDEDFAGLRSFHAGDPPSRIAWKVYARGMGLFVKEYGGTSVTSHVFDYDALGGLDREARLSLICRWVLDAHAAGHAYGLKLPGTELPVNLGTQHRDRCLKTLALFEAPINAA